MSNQPDNSPDPMMIRDFIKLLGSTDDLSVPKAKVGSLTGLPRRIMDSAIDKLVDATMTIREGDTELEGLSREEVRACIVEGVDVGLYKLYEDDKGMYWTMYQGGEYRPL